MAGTVIDNVVETNHTTGNGGRVEQWIGIAHLNGVQEVPGHTCGKHTQVSTQQRIVTGTVFKTGETGAGGCVGEADRVGDLITHLGNVRTGLGDIDRRHKQGYRRTELLMLRDGVTSNGLYITSVLDDDVSLVDQGIGRTNRYNVLGLTPRQRDWSRSDWCRRNVG